MHFVVKTKQKYTAVMCQVQPPPDTASSMARPGPAPASCLTDWRSSRQLKLTAKGVQRSQTLINWILNDHDCKNYFNLVIDNHLISLERLICHMEKYCDSNIVYFSII